MPLVTLLPSIGLFEEQKRRLRVRDHAGSGRRSSFLLRAAFIQAGKHATARRAMESSVLPSIQSVEMLNVKNRQSPDDGVRVARPAPPGPRPYDSETEKVT